MIPRETLPDWMPSEAAGVDVLAAGIWWDAVRMPWTMGLSIVTLLAREGPVIRNQVTTSLTWLIPRGGADGWELPPRVEVLRAGRQLTVPAATLIHTTWRGEPGDGPATSWLVPPTGHCLTDPDALHRAMWRTARTAPR